MHKVVLWYFEHFFIQDNDSNSRCKLQKIQAFHLFSQTLFLSLEIGLPNILLCVVSATAKEVQD